MFLSIFSPLTSIHLFLLTNYRFFVLISHWSKSGKALQIRKAFSACVPGEVILGVVGSVSRTVYTIAQAFGQSHFLGRDMESPHSVNSPRRTLSLSKQRRKTVSVFDPDDKTSGFGLSGDHGPKPSEVYGFVGSITTVVATVIFFIWAYVPESWLQSAGISYYPSRYWALAVPTYVMVTVVLMLGFYIGLNFISTP